MFQTFFLCNGFNRKLDNDGEYVIDRDPKVFGTIMNYFRHGDINTDGFSHADRQDCFFFKFLS